MSLEYLLSLPETFFFFFAMLGIKFMALYMTGKCSTTEQHPA
jgi:hypothetical protein